MKTKSELIRVFHISLMTLSLISLFSCRGGNVKEGGVAPEDSRTVKRSGDVEISVYGLGPARGEMMLRVIPEKYARKFPNVPPDAPEMAYILPISTKENKVLLADLPYGKYSIALIHDKNRNGKLDTLLGFTPPPWLPLPSWPTEGYGFSCYKPGFFLRMKPGPPVFRATSFEVSSSFSKVDVYMNYFWRRYGWTSLAFGIPVIMGAVANGVEDPNELNRCNSARGE